MSRVDQAWLRMDDPRNLMVIVGVWLVDEPIRLEELATRLRERLLPFDRFRQRVVDEDGSYWWVEDRDFRLDRHLKAVRLRAPGGQAQLREFVGRIATRPLDHRHPLWQFHLVENVDGASAIVMRIHHCIADGVALVRVALSLTDEVFPPGADPCAAPSLPSEADAADDEPTDDADGEPDHEGFHGFEQFVRPLTHSARLAAKAAGAALGASVEIAGDGDLREAIVRAAPRATADALRIALMLEDSRTALKGGLAGRKRVAWNRAQLPLAEVKAVCKVLDVSVNDVLLSCVAGALHRYLQSIGEDTAGKELRAMVPVNLRPPDEPLNLGNRFGLVPLTLPVGIANPLERLFELRRRMDQLKDGFQGPIAFAVLGAVGSAPRGVQKLVLDYLATKATAVMTNVPGPREPIRMFGRTLSRMMFWVPQSGSIGLGVSILSYGGGVEFGVIADTNVCPEPQQIIDGFQPEFERLLLTLSLLPRELVQSGALDPSEVEQRLFESQWRHAGDGAARRRRAGTKSPKAAGGAPAESTRSGPRRASPSRP